ncbi:hypothetical protein ASPFODRAFT_712246 [Aspergillus luchuensis CBS 106.47]|uniref:Uncharacterized protein n=1 Tax=Aspergillus luchuensis (strain CBS 106.47) TaxID=1137211 RepID=A0A1M3SZB0_ASPLC|nr:hypothetical protein ASPFODRAFT_712246 [Aspergillus luchuensis CBS 106.47]
MDTTWVQHLRSKSAEAPLLLGICSNQFTCFVLVVKDLLLLFDPRYPVLVRNGILFGVSLCLVLYLLHDDYCIDQSLLSRLDGVVLAELYIVTGLINLVIWLRPTDPRVVTAETMIMIYVSRMMERRMVCAALCAVTHGSSVTCEQLPSS